jgi:hypothetical protein
LAFRPGNRRDEAEIHAALKMFHIRGEWFTYSIAVQDYIADAMTPAHANWRATADRMLKAVPAHDLGGVFEAPTTVRHRP